MPHDPHSLTGLSVVEIGIRQAWPFITFSSDEEIGRPTELRLFIDTTCEVRLPPSHTLDLASDDPAGTLHALLELLNLTVAVVTVGPDGGLVLDFDGGSTLCVSGVAEAWTTHDVWWLGDPHADTAY
ncbi:hypothetical protein AB0L86_26430 [Micromonospora musae]|uniref:hypothetical protein n=1 Tax=Micromonospora musae TaxID=1894970 RepID=UPI00341C522E